jgi:hypothetical protein
MAKLAHGNRARERVTQRVPSRLSGRELLEELHA